MGIPSGTAPIGRSIYRKASQERARARECVARARQRKTEKERQTDRQGQLAHVSVTAVAAVGSNARLQASSRGFGSRDCLQALSRGQAHVASSCLQCSVTPFIILSAYSIPAPLSLSVCTSFVICLSAAHHELNCAHKHNCA